MPARIGPRRPVRVYLALWREAANPTLSQEQLGLRFKPPVSKGTVSKWENALPGKLTLGVIAAYAEALDRAPADMYRHPDQGPSLDALAADLDEDARKVVADTIAALRRRAG
jgi:transcriptional regulator with XRE-family HTH domain